jgi:ParB-like chromosome segregation protein Spo0J
MKNPAAHSYLPLSQLLVPPGRQRQEFDPAALLELASSISLYGLFHAIQVRLDGHTLVTGERRVRAIQEHLLPLGKVYTYDGQPVPAGCIPVIAVSSDDPIVLEEIELDENLKRKDLTWKELATTTARLDALRQQQALRKAVAEGSVPDITGLPAGAAIARQLHTVADTAKEVRGSSIGGYQETTRQEILIAKHLDKPEIANAPTLKDAFKALKRLEETGRNQALAAMIGSTYSSDMHKVVQVGADLLVIDQAGSWPVTFALLGSGQGAHPFLGGGDGFRGVGLQLAGDCARPIALENRADLLGADRFHPGGAAENIHHGVRLLRHPLQRSALDFHPELCHLI